MSSPSQALVHHLLATHLDVDECSVNDADHLGELGLHPLDLVLLVLRLEDLAGGERDFPLCALDRARTVGDLVLLVDLWMQRPEARTLDAGARGGRSKVA
jgi:hypothetical protein